MKRTSLVIHSNREDDTFFRSTDHCQKMRAPTTYPDGFGPISFALPHRVAERPCLPDGMVRTEADVLAVYFEGATEIQNPDPAFRV